MRTIHKYPLAFDEDNSVVMPTGSRLVLFAIQNGIPHVWADVITGNQNEVRRLAIHGTGHPVGTLSRHIGSLQDGPFVWHLYDKDGLA